MEKFLDILNIAGSLIFVFVAIGLCILSHEFGHFLAGKWRKLHIDAFSLGFKPLWRKKIGEVEYRIGWLPFGGYVELPQIDATDGVPKSADGKELPKAKAIDRVITAAAGPIFNILFGFLVGALVWAVGMPQDTAKMRELQVTFVDPAGPEYASGLRAGDVITKLNGRRFHLSWAHFVKEILFSVDPVKLEVRRGGETLNFTYVPKVNPNAPGSLSAEGIAWPFFRVLIPIAVNPEPGSPAEKAGIKSGDILSAIDGKTLEEPSDFQLYLDTAGDRPVELTLNREGKSYTVRVKSEVIPNLPESFTRYLIGVTMKPTPAGPEVISVIPGSSADKAGIKAGDHLVNALPVSVREFQQLTELPAFIRAIQSFKDQTFRLHYIRNGKAAYADLACRKIIPRTIGISVAVYDHPTPWAQFTDTLAMSWKSLRGICVGIGNKLGLTERSSSLKPSHMSGPLGIGTTLFNSVYHSSLMTGIYFMVVISFALAIFNLLPFPVLDGGHIFFGVVEMIIRRPLPVAVIKALSSVFIALLIALMVFVTFADGRRLFRDFFPSKAEKTESSVTNAPSKPQP